MEKGLGVKDRDTPPCKNQRVKLHEKKFLDSPGRKQNYPSILACVDPESFFPWGGGEGVGVQYLLFCNFTIFMRSANDQCVNPLCKVSLYYM